MNSPLVSKEEQLMLLKAMTVRTGSIHEAQALQLKMWPMMIKGVYLVEARIDTEHQEVTMLCDADGFKMDKLNKRLVKEICSWTRKILWDKTKVVIKINGKAIFNSDNP